MDQRQSWFREWKSARIWYIKFTLDPYHMYQKKIISNIFQRIHGLVDTGSQF